MREKENRIMKIIGVITAVVAVMVLMIVGFHNSLDYSSDYSSEYDKMEDRLQEIVWDEIFSVDERNCVKTKECDWLVVKVYYDVNLSGFGKFCPVCGSGY